MYQAMLAESRKIGTFGHGFTYSGHPVAAAVALKTLEIYARERIVETGRSARAPQFQARLKALGEHPLVGEARGLGLIGGARTRRRQADASARSMPSTASAARCVRFAEEEGLIVRALPGDVVSRVPAADHQRADEIDELFDRLARALDRTLDWASARTVVAA